MLRITVLAVCLAGFFFPALADESEEKVVKTHYTCPIDGCKLECLVDNREPIVVTGIRELTMTAYRHIGTHYLLDLGMEGKRTVIIDGDAVFCQISNYK